MSAIDHAHCLIVTVPQMRGAQAMALSLSSPAFDDGAEIPRRYTCEGDDVSPPLTWTGVPEGTRSLVLIVDDPDAPDPGAPRMTWVHWVVYNLPSTTTGLDEACASLPDGAATGLNDWKKAAYGGPCPPIGRHRYFHKLYALDAILSGFAQPTKAEIEHFMVAHILDQASLMGTYQKSD
jgi:Raf kinase inhibitor-like YbhB/YbcL family protein